jgi:hypothetical protein
MISAIFLERVGKYSIVSEKDVQKQLEKNLFMKFLKQCEIFNFVLTYFQKFAIYAIC